MYLSTMESFQDGKPSYFRLRGVVNGAEMRSATGDRLGELRKLAVIQHDAAAMAGSLLRALREQDPPISWPNLAAAYGVPVATLHRLVQGEGPIPSKSYPTEPPGEESA